MGAYFEHRGKFAEARKWYARAAAPDDAEANFRIGNLEYRSENYHEAIPFLEMAVEGGYASLQSVKRLAVSLERTGDAYGAERIARRAAEQNPSEPEYGEILASIQNRNAQQELKQLKLEKSDSAQSDESGKSTKSPELNRDDPAWLRAEVLASRRGERSNDANWTYHFATVLEEAGRLHDAALAFDDACSLSPRSWWWYRCGRAFAASGNLEASRVRYARAVDGDRKLDSNKWGIGVFHEEAKCWDFAALDFERAALDAAEVWRRAGLYYRAGRNHLLAMDFQSAEQCLRRALTLRPGNTAWARMLADALELQDKLEEAAEVLELLARSGELSASAERSLEWARGRIHYKMGDNELAIQHLRASLGDDSERSTDPSGMDVPGVDVPDVDAHPEWQASSLDGNPFMFHGSTDRRGHVERSRIAGALRHESLRMDCLRKAQILSSTNDEEISTSYSTLLARSGDMKKATEVLLRTRVFWGPYPHGFARPKPGTYAYQLAAYMEWRENLPVDPEVILYETNLGLSIDCNPLALCRHLLSGENQYVHVWAVDGDVPIPIDLLEHNDILVVQKDSLQYTRLLATAKYLINNSTFPTYFSRRQEQKYLMTWHGTPLKTLAKDMKEPLVHLNMARNYLQASMAIFPNEHTRHVLIEGTDVHGLLSAEVEITGYPRNDALAKLLPSDVPHQGARVLYAPTWREDSELENQVEELLRVRDAIIEAGHRPLLRAHHYVESAATAVDPEIQFVPRRTPTNDLLPEVDILITDFSSIYFDFAITGRPMLFYTPDWERYAATRGMYFSRAHFPGPICDSLDELRSALVTPTVDSPTRQEFLDEFAPNDDGGAAERVCRAFFSEQEPKQENALSEKSPAHERGVLIRQAFIPNGMTSSFVNLVTTLSERSVPVTVLTDGRAVQEDTGRQSTLAKLPASARVIGRVGMQPKTMLQYHASIASRKNAGAPSKSLRYIIDAMYRAEAHRVLPVTGFISAIEFDGYSEFMARVVRAIGECSYSTAIYLHNDIRDEIRLRMPELKGVVEIVPEFDHVVAVSEGSARVNAEKLGSAYGIDTSRFTYARNLIRPEHIKSQSEIPLPEDVVAFADSANLLLVQVGRISPEKNHAFSVEVIDELQDLGIHAKLLIVGDGPLAPMVSNMVTEKNLDEFVYMAGWVENPYPYIARADAMVLPSFHEGQPMVILEAQTIGTPVIGSDISSLQAMGADGPETLLPLAVSDWVSELRARYDSDRTHSTGFDGDSYVEMALEEFCAATGVEVPSRGSR
ncbi:glycosyl/glycerophosphate transferase, teichoic acid biosynthesis [Brachybacterium faecium DSM 4810]|uniref:Glycosyl/glycerophosphate transferase, teichoic acid biosynthesis n=1 Tax=Brachybacterium faecium (strain ATCC 43885 / DSM 4810 / JCM 11609 / LMG 19847 / NBRC 14762 / NCIMB 9860 / 6-10) TaxID=446465 RepID=C7MHN7_BRAFD|nr:glycosyl/glycerophosphate transferase, teichoic acid biosynthesis [Brachybacterium faecium DSM 4810]